MSDYGIDGSAFAAAGEALTAAGYKREAGKIVSSVLKKAGNIVRREVRAAMRPHRRTGKMADKVRNRVDGYGLDTRVTVRAGGSIAHLITGGTRPHELAPVRAGAMTIRGPGKGAPIVAIRRGPLHHPGTRPDPVFARGVDASRPYLDELFGTAADGILREIANLAAR